MILPFKKNRKIVRKAKLRLASGKEFNNLHVKEYL